MALLGSLGWGLMELVVVGAFEVVLEVEVAGKNGGGFVWIVTFSRSELDAIWRFVFAVGIWGGPGEVGLVGEGLMVEGDCLTFCFNDQIFIPS